jgi:hypothetical protein
MNELREAEKRAAQTARHIDAMRETIAEYNQVKPTPIIIFTAYCIIIFYRLL